MASVYVWCRCDSLLTSYFSRTKYMLALVFFIIILQEFWVICKCKMMHVVCCPIFICTWIKIIIFAYCYVALLNQSDNYWILRRIGRKGLQTWGPQKTHFNLVPFFLFDFPQLYVSEWFERKHARPTCTQALTTRPAENLYRCAGLEVSVMCLL